mgnify:CR=1 FL=1
MKVINENQKLNEINIASHKEKNHIFNNINKIKFLKAIIIITIIPFILYIILIKQKEKEINIGNLNKGSKPIINEKINTFSNETRESIINKQINLNLNETKQSISNETKQIYNKQINK